MPANGGDFLWLCYGCGNRRSHILIDSGYGQCYKDYSAVMRYIYEAGETVEAVLLTHIDNDHIGGFLRWLLQTPFVSPQSSRFSSIMAATSSAAWTLGFPPGWKTAFLTMRRRKNTAWEPLSISWRPFSAGDCLPSCTVASRPAQTRCTWLRARQFDGSAPPVPP